MTVGQIFLILLVLAFTIGAILAVFYIWFHVWKIISERSGNIVKWDEDSVGKGSSDRDADKKTRL